MRLYHGVKVPYSPSRIVPSRFSKTFFADCPIVALLHARGARGELVVMDIDLNEALASHKIIRPHWANHTTSRFILGGRFHHYVVGVFSARELRMRLVRDGPRHASRVEQSRFLREFIDKKIPP